MITKDLTSAGIRVVLAIAGLAVLWIVKVGLLLIFAAALMALLLQKAAAGARKLIPLSQKATVISIVLALLALMVIALGIAAPVLKEQLETLRNELPTALDTTQSLLAYYGVSDWVQLSDIGSRFLSVLGPASDIVSIVSQVVSGAVVIVVLGVFMAIEPQSHVDTILDFLPKKTAKKIQGVLPHIADAMWDWLKARLISMIVVAVLTGFGLTVIGLELGFLLGIITGLLSFIPTIGVFIALIPSVLYGVSQGGEYVLYVGVVFAIVQLLENNFITPYIQGKAMQIPAGMIILAQLIIGLLFGGGWEWPWQCHYLFHYKQ